MLTTRGDRGYCQGEGGGGGGCKSVVIRILGGEGGATCVHAQVCP